MLRASRTFLLAVAGFGPAGLVAAQAPVELRVGHWVEIRGGLQDDDRFLASTVEVLAPQDEELLIGIATEVDASGSRFELLGRTVRVSDRTEWRDVELGSLEGARVKVEGHWRGRQLFSARKISPRKDGRDRISGRVDDLGRIPQGLEILVQGFRVVVPSTVLPESEFASADLALAPEQKRELPGGVRVGRDEWVPTGLRLTEDLSFGVLLEYKAEREDGFDLDDGSKNDEQKHRLSAKGQFLWTPSESFHGLLAGRVELSDDRDEDDPDDRGVSSRIDELWGYWSDIGTKDLDLQVGRLDFDDQREWIYRKKLDGARVFWERNDFALELSATTVLTNGSDRDENTNNLIAYLAKGDEYRELALWLVDRRDERSPADSPIHFGARALGDWIPQNEAWADASLVRGYSNDVNLEGWAYDVGTTWSPPFAGPLALTAGWAFASGDDPSSAGTDESYRQTGLQRNNGRFGGVTSFRYYGEVVDPELSNLSILTVGLGARPWRRTSIDLVWHAYQQVEAATFLRDSDIDADPDGIHEDLGQELDLIVGTKAIPGWDFEVVVGRFEPGDAFPGGDEAWIFALQMRFRF
ncbi:MAG: alginate export family protein [Planctomycetota bacterium]